MKLRRVLLLLSVIVTLISNAKDWDIDHIKEQCRGRRLDPVEGIWRFPGDGAMVCILRSGAEEFEMRILTSSDLSVRPGTPVGTLYSTAKRGYYEGRIESRRLGLKHKPKGRNIVFNINSDGRLCIEGYRKGYSVSFKRLFYRIFKISIDERDDMPRGLVGARRVYPIDPYSDLPICL